MLNVGVDIIETARFKPVRHLARLGEFFLTPKELAQAGKAPDIHQFYASRFALKEAVIKAVPEPLKYLDFEIIKSGRAPKVRFLIKRLNKYKVAVSLSHTEISCIGFAAASF